MLIVKNMSVKFAVGDSDFFGISRAIENKDGKVNVELRINGIEIPPFEAYIVGSPTMRTTVDYIGSDVLPDRFITELDVDIQAVYPYDYMRKHRERGRAAFDGHVYPYWVG